MAVRPARAFRRTPEQLAQFQARLDEMMVEIFALLWLEEVAWRMYGIEVEKHPEGNSHGTET